MMKKVVISHKISWLVMKVHHDMDGSKSEPLMYPWLHQSHASLQPMFNHIYMYIYRFLRTCDFVVKDVNPFSRIPARPGQTSAQGIAVDTRAWRRWPTRAAGAGWVTRRGKARWVCFTYVHHIYYMCVRFTGISKSIVSMVILILCINIYIYMYLCIYIPIQCVFLLDLMGFNGK